MTKPQKHVKRKVKLTPGFLDRDLLPGDPAPVPFELPRGPVDPLPERFVLPEGPGLPHPDWKVT